MRSRIPRPAAAVSCALLAACAVAGCGESRSAQQASGKAEQSEAGPLDVEFTGPWAADFAEEYRDAESDFVRNVLRDGKITDAEVAEMQSKMKACLDARGLFNAVFDDTGSLVVDDPPELSREEKDRRMEECHVESGEPPISRLYYEVKRNPENRDENTIIAECLVRAGVREKGYTGEDYERESEEIDLIGTARGSGSGTAAFHACAVDPLGKLNHGTG